MQMNFAGPSQIRRAIHGARREVLLAMAGDGSPLDDQIDVTAAHAVTGVSGVRVRMYVPLVVRDGADAVDRQLAGLAKEGIEIHPAPDNNPRMAIVDRSVVVLARNRSDYSDGALIGNGLPFTDMLVGSLTLAGRVPAAVDAEAAGPDSGPGADEQLDPLSREVLRHMALGIKDEAAARKMGMALRTYRRTAARLMTSLGARSRFQAGYLAGQRSWC
ncbi:hypothetical protein ACFV97_14055 [Streptomyces sp. NPDC059913]|uniref:hypothetical protein n=1 Tax=unclassified Streptomyces TaxID=2593676 RepID=UPI00364D3A94